MNNTGYFYIVFQHMPFNNYLRCWIDGSEDYEYFSESELLDLVKSVNSDISFVADFLNAFATDSIYLWDINNSKVDQLHNMYTEETPIRSMLPSVNSFRKNSQNNDTYTFELPKILK